MPGFYIRKPVEQPDLPRNSFIIEVSVKDFLIAENGGNLDDDYTIGPISYDNMALLGEIVTMLQEDSKVDMEFFSKHKDLPGIDYLKDSLTRSSISIEDYFVYYYNADKVKHHVEVSFDK